MSVLIWIGVFIGFSLESQDTVFLTDVEVYAPALDRFAQGQKIQNFSKSDLRTYSGRSLADLLQEGTPVFVKQYGAGMLATASFRGTSAGHTAIFWNGIPINSPSLGQSDLSILPMTGFEKVAIHFGNGGALFGNEAIGGSIHLSTDARFEEGFHGKLTQQIGSFGLLNNYIHASFSDKKFSSKTQFYRESAENDFKFQDLGRIGTPKTRQGHAAFQHTGIIQDLALNLGSSEQLKASVWYSQVEREIQPLMGSKATDMQEDHSFRMSVDYFYFGKKSVLNLKTGFVREEQVFNLSENRTSQYFLTGDWDASLSRNWSIKTGLRFHFLKGNLSTYQATDQRIEGYQSIRFQPKEKLSITLNLRQLAYLNQLEPFIPSLGADWKLWKGDKQDLSLKTSISKGIKIPTLNDRFWNPGGNPDLLPENSQSGEIGLTHQKSGEKIWENSLTYYRMEVDNWIIWLPKGNIWTPENIRKVNNQGIEYQGKVSTKLGDWQLVTNWSYTWTRAIATKGIGQTDPSIGKQLPYTPQHQANGRISMKKNHFSAFLGSFFVGERSITSDGIRTMPAYQLVNLGFSSTQLSWGAFKIPLSFQINNLLNKDYQVLYLRAMPGRAYQFTLSLQF